VLLPPEMFCWALLLRVNHKRKAYPLSSQDLLRIDQSLSESHFLGTFGTPYSKNKAEVVSSFPTAISYESDPNYRAPFQESSAS
jgi:hypothetical protein